MRRDKVHGNEPLLERKLGVLKDCTCGTGEVMLAVVATITSVSTSHTVVLTAMGANNVITPTNLRKRLLANLFVVEVVDN
jgi:cobalamin synthase